MTFLTHSTPSTNHHLAFCTGHRGRWATIAVTLTLLGSLLLGGSVTGAVPDLTPQPDPRDLHVQATMSEVIRILEEISRDPAYVGREDELFCWMCLLANPDHPEVCKIYCGK